MRNLWNSGEFSSSVMEVKLLLFADIAEDLNWEKPRFWVGLEEHQNAAMAQVVARSSMVGFSNFIIEPLVDI